MDSRERRKTAGRRMTALVGKALEDDEAFWTHDTWNEEDSESGNDSFHESDEDSDMRKDEFDSDFNDSETDNDDEEVAAGEEAEAALRKVERSSKRKNNYVDIASAGRDLMAKKKGKGKRRILGSGMNAGIVLNIPGSSSAPSMDQPPQLKTKLSTTKPKAKEEPSVRIRRSMVGSPRKLRETRSTAPSSPAEKRGQGSQGGVSKKSKRRRYTQEELLLEAVKETEPENKRWLLARKRSQASAENEKEATTMRDMTKGEVVQKYHSRRGYLITLTFPSMDAVPEILAKRHEPPKRPNPAYCVITGKRARYKDPKTKLGYYDVAAFKELRRRLETGEIKLTEDNVAIPSHVEEEKIPTDTNVSRPKQEFTSTPVPKTPAIREEPSTVASTLSQVKQAPSAGSTSDSSKSIKSKPKRQKDSSTASNPTPRKRSRSGSGGTEPPSPSRSSPRRWKPSSKVLQTLQSGEGLNTATIRGLPMLTGFDSTLVKKDGTNESRDEEAAPTSNARSPASDEQTKMAETNSSSQSAKNVEQDASPPEPNLESSSHTAAELSKPAISSNATESTQNATVAFTTNDAIAAAITRYQKESK